MSCDICDGAPTRAQNQIPFFFQNFLTRSVSFNLNGAQINALAVAGGGTGATFPVCVKVAEIDLGSNAGLISLSLSTSITNFTAGATCAVYLGLANSDITDVNGMQRNFLQQICGQNSVPGLPNAASRTNAVQMGQNSYYSVNSGQKIAIYASAPNDAATLLTGVATVFWFAR